ncbi:MAG: VOC family protein [Ferruginibacter sp.]
MEKLSENTNALNWFEISVSDFNRAKKFYETIFGITMEAQNMMGMDMAFFPYDPTKGKIGGALVKGPMHTPSADGVKVYLNGNPDLAIVLSKVEKAGGKVTMPKTKISDDIGHMAFFTDSEGNTIALHSNN